MSHCYTFCVCFLTLLRYFDESCSVTSHVVSRNMKNAILLSVYGLLLFFSSGWRFDCALSDHGTSKLPQNLRHLSKLRTYVLQVSCHYSANTVLLHSMRRTSVALEAKFNGLQRRFYNAATMAKDFQLRFIYAYDDVIVIVLRPSCRSCAYAAFVLRLDPASV